MKKAAIATFMLLLCSAWTLAQQSNPPNQNSSAEKATVQGCLNRSDSSYTLTDKSGAVYQLTGDTSKLSAHVSHEVQITGTQAEAGASSQSAQTQFEVSGMKHVSETCSSAPKSEKPSEKPPQQ